jgi:hypothetical protein
MFNILVVLGIIYLIFHVLGIIINIVYLVRYTIIFHNHNSILEWIALYLVYTIGLLIFSWFFDFILNIIKEKIGIIDNDY